MLREFIHNRFFSFYGRWKYPTSATVFTHLTEREKYQLYSLARSVFYRKSTRFLEVGSYLGASALVLASALKHPAMLYCVDTWQNDAMSEGPRDTFYEFNQNTQVVSNIIMPCRGKSVDIAVTFPGHLDFIFFDGDHSYEGVKQDTQAWLPKLVSGGVVVYHDYGWAEGVQQVVREEIAPKAVRTGCLPNMFWATLR